MTWGCERVSEMISGEDTLIFRDDEYSIIVGSSSVNYSGKAFTITIFESLLYRSGYFWPHTSSLTIETEEESTITIDYVTGECDNEATSTIDGETSTITLG